MIGAVSVGKRSPIRQTFFVLFFIYLCKNTNLVNDKAQCNQSGHIQCVQCLISHIFANAIVNFADVHTC